MKKKDVLFLCQFFYPEYVSSATLPYDTAVALKNAGFSVDALCGYPHEYADGKEVPVKEDVNGIGIHRVKYIQMDRKKFIGRLVNYFSLTFMMAMHLFKLAKYKSVIVYSNPPLLPWVAAWAKKLFGTRLIFVAYDLYPEIAVRMGALRDGNIICRLMSHINQAVYKHADQVIALSSEMKAYIAENRPIKEDCITVIPNWYEQQPEETGDRKKDNTFSELIQNRFTVSYFGNMGTAQDMETILGAMRLLKDDEGICFLLAGHGNKLDQLRETVEKEGIGNVYMQSFLRGKAFRDALRISDAALVSLEKGLVGLCVPSKTYSYMGQGIPLLAIMEPCDIVSDIESGAGMWVRNGEANALADAIRKMRDDAESVNAMRNKCRTLFEEKYTTDICTKQYVNTIQKLL